MWWAISKEGKYTILIGTDLESKILTMPKLKDNVPIINKHMDNGNPQHSKTTNNLRNTHHVNNKPTTIILEVSGNNFVQVTSTTSLPKPNITPIWRTICQVKEFSKTWVKNTLPKHENKRNFLNKCKGISSIWKKSTAKRERIWSSINPKCNKWRINCMKKERKC